MLVEVLSRPGIGEVRVGTKEGESWYCVEDLMDVLGVTILHWDGDVDVVDEGGLKWIDKKALYGAVSAGDFDRGRDLMRMLRLRCPMDCREGECWPGLVLDFRKGDLKGIREQLSDECLTMDEQDLFWCESVLSGVNLFLDDGRRGDRSARDKVCLGVFRKIAGCVVPLEPAVPEKTGEELYRARLEESRKKFPLGCDVRRVRDGKFGKVVKWGMMDGMVSGGLTVLFEDGRESGMLFDEVERV